MPKFKTTTSQPKLYQKWATKSENEGNDGSGTTASIKTLFQDVIMSLLCIITYESKIVPSR